MAKTTKLATLTERKFVSEIIQQCHLHDPVDALNDLTIALKVWTEHVDQLPGEKNSTPIKDVFFILDQLRGYRPPKRAAEAASILRMLKTYSADQVIDTWKKLKADKFYQDKELYMMTVEGQIGAVITSSQNSGQYIIPPGKFQSQKFGGLVQR